jgi:Tol biopolymer transport system component
MVHDSAAWAWAPNSRRLAYTDGEGRLALFDVSTQTNRILVPAEEKAWGTPVWSADGSQIAYATAYPLPVDSSVQRQQSIWRVQPDNGYRVELARNTAPDTTLLLPEAWIDGTTAVLAWDLKAGTAGDFPALYRVDVASHQLEPVEALSAAHGPQLAWPVSAQGVTLGLDDDQLHLLNLTARTRQPILERVPWPNTMAWAPNGAWLAFTVTNRAEGAGLYVFAPEDRSLRQVRLPKGATEKAVFWADMEHLFVIRQGTASSATELWIVSLTSGEAQRIITNVEAPLPDVYNGWRWQDVLAMQAIR